MTKGKHIQQAFDDIDPDNFGMCGVRGVGSQTLSAISEMNYNNQRIIKKWIIK